LEETAEHLQLLEAEQEELILVAVVVVAPTKVQAVLVVLVSL
jgi:hypothetical protein